MAFLRGISQHLRSRQGQVPPCAEDPKTGVVKKSKKFLKKVAKTLHGSWKSDPQSNNESPIPLSLPIPPSVSISFVSEVLKEANCCGDISEDKPGESTLRNVALSDAPGPTPHEGLEIIQSPISAFRHKALVELSSDSLSSSSAVTPGSSRSYGNNLIPHNRASTGANERRRIPKPLPNATESTRFSICDDILLNDPRSTFALSAAIFKAIQRINRVPTALNVGWQYNEPPRHLALVVRPRTLDPNAAFELMIKTILLLQKLSIDKGWENACKVADDNHQVEIDLLREEHLWALEDQAKQSRNAENYLIRDKQRLQRELRVLKGNLGTNQEQLAETSEALNVSEQKLSNQTKELHAMSQELLALKERCTFYEHEREGFQSEVSKMKEEHNASQEQKKSCYKVVRNALAHQVCEAKADYDKIAAEATAVCQENQDLRAALDESKEVISDREIHLQALQRDVGVNWADAEDPEWQAWTTAEPNELRNAQKTLEQSQHMLEKAHKDAGELNEALRQTRHELEAVKAKAARTEASLKLELGQKNKEIQTTVREHDRLKAQHLSEQNASQSRRKETETVKMANSVAETFVKDSETIETEALANLRRVHDLERQKAAVESSLDEQVSALRFELETTRLERKEWKSQATFLECEMCDMKGDLAEAKDSLEDANSRINSDQTVIQALEQDYTALLKNPGSTAAHLLEAFERESQAHKETKQMCDGYIQFTKHQENKMMELEADRGCLYTFVGNQLAHAFRYHNEAKMARAELKLYKERFSQELLMDPIPPVLEAPAPTAEEQELLDEIKEAYDKVAYQSPYTPRPAFDQDEHERQYEELLRDIAQEPFAGRAKVSEPAAQDDVSDDEAGGVPLSLGEVASPSSAPRGSTPPESSEPSAIFDSSPAAHRRSSPTSSPIGVNTMSSQQARSESSEDSAIDHWF